MVAAHFLSDHLVENANFAIVLLLYIFECVTVCCCVVVRCIVHCSILHQRSTLNNLHRCWTQSSPPSKQALTSACATDCSRAQGIPRSSCLDKARARWIAILTSTIKNSNCTQQKLPRGAPNYVLFLFPQSNQTCCHDDDDDRSWHRILHQM